MLLLIFVLISSSGKTESGSTTEQKTTSVTESGSSTEQNTNPSKASSDQVTTKTADDTVVDQSVAAAVEHETIRREYETREQKEVDREAHQDRSFLPSPVVEVSLLTSLIA